MDTLDPRALTLQANLAAVRERIGKAAGAVEPTLIVVTKFHPATDVQRLRRLGVADVGENRDQEAAAKALEVADPALRWHFIGQLQKNKAKNVVQYAHSVHSIDRASLIGALGRAMAVQQDLDGRTALDCFIQVDLSAEPQPAAGSGEPGARGGAAPSEVGMLAELLAGTAGLALAGVMAVAPLGAGPEAAFGRLAEISAALVHNHPGATGISAGMSHDLEAAIRAGATHLRVGSDILGPRPAVG
jgi:PLP dependent protein